MENKTKKLWVLLGVLVVIVLIIVVAASQGKKKAAAPVEQTTPISQPVTEPTATPVTPTVTIEALKDAKVEAPGASAVTKDNKVVTLTGEVTRTDVGQSSPLAPAMTRAIDKEQLAPTAIKLDVSAAGYSPKEFTVSAGAPVTLALTSTDSSLHGLVFEDGAMSAIGLTSRPNQTRAVTFNAPTQPGEYTFFCNVGGVLHKNRGEIGKMIVK